jgi:hypothetical protein
MLTEQPPEIEAASASPRIRATVGRLCARQIISG